MNIDRCLFLLVSGFMMLSSSAYSAPLMYVPTGETNEIVVIDVATDKVVNRITELENTHGLASNLNTRYLVAGSMKLIESNKKQAVAKPAAVTDAEHEAHHAGGTKGNASKKIKDNPSLVSIVDPELGKVVRRISVRGLTHHTAVSPDGKFAIAVHSGAGGISVIDLQLLRVVKTIQTGLWPNYAVFTKDGNFLYISNALPGTVSEINTRNWKIVREMKVGKEPEHLVLGKENRMLYAVNKGDGTVSVLNLANGKVQRTYSVGKSPHGMDLSDDGQWLFVSSKGSEIIKRIDVFKGDVTELKLKPAPYHVAYIPGKARLYVSSRKLPKIWVIDPVSMTIKKEINLGVGAVGHQMVIRSE